MEDTNVLIAISIMVAAYGRRLWSGEPHWTDRCPPGTQRRLMEDLKLPFRQRSIMTQSAPMSSASQTIRSGIWTGRRIADPIS